MPFAKLEWRYITLLKIKIQMLYTGMLVNCDVLIVAGAQRSVVVIADCRSCDVTSSRSPWQRVLSSAANDVLQSQWC